MSATLPFVAASKIISAVRSETGRVLAEWLQVPDQDGGVHQRHKVQACAAHQRYRAGELSG